MQQMIDIICNGAETFTPQVLVGLIVFSLVLESIGDLAANILKLGGKF